ncbi:MAG TPA: site-specific integrase [Blastocatellia bacterium]|nr:site-specific integrase [Blastocatellia bacterium]
MKPKTGHIFKRGKSWYGRVSYTDEEGKRRFVKRAARTKSEAREKVNDLIREIEERGSVDGSRMTFKELVDRFKSVKLVPARYVDGKKVAGYRSLYSQTIYVDLLQEHFGRKFIRSITHADLEAFKLRRLQTETRFGGQRTVASVNREMEMMRRMLNFALRNGWIQKSPFHQGDSLISKAEETKRTRLMSFEEEARLLAVCEGRIAHLRPIIIVAVDTAMRRGELLKLCWKWVDFDERIIHLPGTITKTRKARDVAMTKRVYDELKTLWEQSTQEPDGLVFGIETNFKHAWTTALKKAGIEDLHFHDLRHSAATRLIAAGVPVAEAMKVTGHETLEMISRYVNVNQDTIRNAAEALELLVTQKLGAEMPGVSELIN